MLLHVLACGICGTDVEEYRHGPVVVPTTPHPLSGQMAPLTLGHEPVGIVRARGRGVTLAVGARVAVETNMVCGQCYWCRRGDLQLCESLASIGLHADGALAERLLVPAYMCAAYGSCPDEVMALAEPLAVAVRIMRRGGVGPGSAVGIVGAGTIGLLGAQVARLWGASTVVCIEPHPARRGLARLLGADAAATPAEAGAALAAYAPARGFDVVVEAAGNAIAARCAVDMTRRGGTCVLAGVYAGALDLPSRDLLFGEKNIVPSLSHVFAQDFVEAVRLLQEGQIETEPLVTDRICLEDLVARGFEALIGDPENHLKVLVFPNAQGSDPA